MREKYVDTALRMDDALTEIIEELKTFIIGSAGIKKEYMDKIKELTIHIDCQDELIRTRIKSLEDVLFLRATAK